MKISTLTVSKISVKLFRLGAILCQPGVKSLFKEYFEKFEIVETVDRPVDKSTGKNKSFCFVTFKKDGVMKLAVKGNIFRIPLWM